MGLMISGKSEEEDIWIKINLPFLVKTLAIIFIIYGCFWSVKESIKPFWAQKELKKEPDFFAQKVVDSQKTINALEERARKKTKDANTYHKLGWIYAKEKRWREAIMNFEMASKLNPNLEGPPNNLGNIYFMLGNKANAVENWKKSIKINPDKTDAHFNLGYCYYTMGKLKEATDEFKKVLEIDPKNYKATIMIEKMVQ